MMSDPDGADTVVEATLTRGAAPRDRVSSEWPRGGPRATGRARLAERRRHPDSLSSEERSMFTRPHRVSGVIMGLLVAVTALAEGQPRRGGVLTWATHQEVD